MFAKTNRVCGVGRRGSPNDELKEEERGADRGIVVL